MPKFLIRQEVCIPRHVIVIADTAEEAVNAAEQYPEAWTEDKSYIQWITPQALEEDGENDPSLFVRDGEVETLDDPDSEVGVDDGYDEDDEVSTYFFGENAIYENEDEDLEDDDDLDEDEEDEEGSTYFFGKDAIYENIGDEDEG